MPRTSGSPSLFAGQHDYRRDIDGLRAFAILSVLVYHTEPAWVPGGFIGVDVFFVISGYLISRIILGKLGNGTFTFSDFYARRIRRILPALLLVLIATFGLGWYALFPDEYARLGKHIAGGAGFVSNLVLWKEAGYFDPAAEFKPLLHLWSLGIEEQFYMIWPLLLALAWKIRRGPLAIMALIAVTSLALNLVWIGDHGVRTFYLPVTRFWELAVGGLLAHAHLLPRIGSARTDVRNKVLPGLKSLTGLAMLLFATFVFTRHDLFPGWRAAVPVFGTALLIDAGMEAPLNRLVLGNRFMVFIGAISYPLYLWHWPLLSFPHIIAGGDVSRAITWAAVGMAFLLAWTTWRFVEWPIRHASSGARIPLLLAGTLASVGVLGLLDFRLVLPPRSDSLDVRNIVAATTARAFPGPKLRHMPGEPLDNAREQGTGPHAVLFIGDSQVEQYYPRINWLLSHESTGTVHILYSSQGGCPPVPGVHEDHLPLCKGLVEQSVRLAARPDVDTVVIDADWAGYFMGLRTPDKLNYYYEDTNISGPLGDITTAVSKRALLRLQDMVQAMTAAGKRVYIVLPSPTGAEFRPRRMVQRSFTDMSFRLHVPVIPSMTVTKRMQPIVDELKRIAGRTRAEVIDPVSFLCNRDICPLLTADKAPVYKDSTHLNPHFVLKDASYMDQVLQPKRAMTLATSKHRQVYLDARVDEGEPNPPLF